MASTTVNGIDAYITNTSGTVTEFLRVNAMIAEEVSFIDTSDANKGGSTLEDYLKTLTYDPTGQNAWDHFKTLVEEFDSAAALTEIGSGDVADVSGTYTQAEVQAIVDRVNALSDYVKSKESSI